MTSIASWSSSAVEFATPFAAPLFFREAFEGYEAPLVLSVSPADGSSLGGENVTIVGDFFAAMDSEGGEAYVTGVSIGGADCPRFTVLDRFTILALTPPGVGASLEVQVRARGGIESLPRQLFRYSRPSVSDIVPSTMFLGQAKTELTVYGSNFGTDVSLV